MTRQTKIIESTAGGGEYHLPVLLKESIDALQIKPDGVYVDCTFGGGGHSRAILNALGKDGRLFAFDQDEDAARNVPDDDRLTFIPHNFRHLQRFLKLHKQPFVDGILADLGVSSHQFDEAERGFSIRFEGRMDMRMDQRKETTAADILEGYTASQLQNIFEKYGEVTNSKTLARAIIELQGTGRLKTIKGFKEAVAGIVKGNPNKYFAQVFQALRIAVNDELVALEELLMQIPDVLHPGGRVAIITFHSLEDRIVKNFFRHGSMLESGPGDMFGTKPLKPLLPVTKKPVVPGDEELKRNPRARSAKLRIAERTPTQRNE
jgi:16S rRNA (cytosine1402-N4)-methyltransferase